MANVKSSGEGDSSLVGDGKISEQGSTASKYLKYALGTALLVIAVTTYGAMSKSKGDIAPISAPSSAETALFDDSGRYVMRNYDDIKPMSNFLAGLGGLWGVPMVSNYGLFILSTENLHSIINLLIFYKNLLLRSGHST